MAYQVISITDGVWAIQDGNVRMYLVDGGQEAALIDTGMSGEDLSPVIDGLVPGRKILVINTHGHGDHTACNGLFHTFYYNRKDDEEIRPACPADADIHFVDEGDVISFGEQELEVLNISGHTPGAIALVSRQKRLLFSGDSFAKHFPVYMQFPGQDMGNYLSAMEKMLALDAAYDRICPCHGEVVIGKEYIGKHITCARQILDGTVEVGTALMSDGSLSRAGWFEDVAIFF